MRGETKRTRRGSVVDIDYEKKYDWQREACAFSKAHSASCASRLRKETGEVPIQNNQVRYGPHR